MTSHDLCYNIETCVIKVAGEQEVKGQVKLMLKDIGGHNIIATRSLVSTQKVTELDYRALHCQKIFLSVAYYWYFR